VTSLERVLASVTGENFDRRPFSLMTSLYGANFTGSNLEHYYTNPDLYVSGQIAAFEIFNQDVLLNPFLLSYLGAAFGGAIRNYDKQPPLMYKPNPNVLEGLDLLEKPDINGNKYLDYLSNTLILLREKTGDTPIAVTNLSPIDLPAIILGIEGWLETLIFKPQYAAELLEVTTEFFIQWSNKNFRDGATFIVLPLPFCNLRIITPKLLKEVAIPVLTKAFKQVNGPIVLHHVGTSLIGSLDSLKNLPNVVGFYVGKEDQLHSCREKLGSKKLIVGNIDGPSLYRRKPEEVKRHVHAILDKMKDDNSYLLATSAADIELDTPLENIRAVKEGLFEFYGVANG